MDMDFEKQPGDGARCAQPSSQLSSFLFFLLGVSNARHISSKS